MMDKLQYAVQVTRPGKAYRIVRGAPEFVDEDVEQPTELELSDAVEQGIEAGLFADWQQIALNLARNEYLLDAWRYVISSGDHGLGFIWLSFSMAISGVAGHGNLSMLSGAGAAFITAFSAAIPPTDEQRLSWNEAIVNHDGPSYLLI